MKAFTILQRAQKGVFSSVYIALFVLEFERSKCVKNGSKSNVFSEPESKTRMKFMKRELKYSKEKITEPCNV